MFYSFGKVAKNILIFLALAVYFLTTFRKEFDLGDFVGVLLVCFVLDNCPRLSGALLLIFLMGLACCIAIF